MGTYMAQFDHISQSLSNSMKRQAARLERFTAQLNFANRLAGIHPGQADGWQAAILEAGRTVQEGLRRPGADIDDLISRGERLLAPIAPTAKDYTLMCVSHAHIDMNWMWSWPETVAVTNDTFRTMLSLMEEFPEFIFSQSQASTYELVEKYAPDLFEVIRARVREGRWEVTASQWVEGDKNMSSGESASRHLLYTREYFQERFGLRPEDIEVDFEPDTFGHPATLPTILAQGGVKYYYHCRGSRGPHLYWWVGPDGSRVLAFNDVQWYMCAIGPGISDALPKYSQTTGLKQMAVLYGVGDHGGGPTRRDLLRMREMNEWPVFPNVAPARLHDFFRYAQANATDLPEITGERNFVFTGCYTTQARQKWANRHGENLLYAAEAAAVLGERLAGVPYPKANLSTAWKHLLFDQFHDILPGSGVRETRHYALGRAQEGQAAAGMARSNALRALAERVDTESLRAAFPDDPERSYKDDLEGGRAMGAGVGYAAGTGGESASSVSRSSDRAFLIFNPLPHPRQDVVEVKLWDTGLTQDHLVVTGIGMDPQMVQVLDSGTYWGHEYITVAFPVDVPGMGYRAVCVSDRLLDLGLTPETPVDPWSGAMGAWRKIGPADDTLENEFLKVRINPASGGIVSLIDKRTGREWIPNGDQAGVFQYSVEANVGMSAWVIGPFMSQEDLLDGGALKRVQSGPHLQAFRWSRKMGASTLDLEIRLRRGVPRVEFRLQVDWREMGSSEGVPNLRVRFPLDVHDPAPRYEIPFGSIRRDLVHGEEVPALRWADLSETDGQGVALANSSKYGFSVDGNSLSMTVLRASTEPDPLPDMGEHVVEYALEPHGAGWALSDSVGVGEEVNVPLAPLSCGFHPGELPAAMTAVSVEPANVRLAALKLAQQGRGMILRLYEVEGRDAEACVTLAPGLVADGASAEQVDMMERSVSENSARIDGHAVSVRVPAHGVAIVRVG